MHFARVVARTVPALGTKEHQWDIIDPRGNLVASIATPSDSQLLAIDGQRIWALVTDSEGGTEIVRYRIAR